MTEKKVSKMFDGIKLNKSLYGYIINTGSISSTGAVSEDIAPDFML